jgi:aspartate kinase
MQVFKFGGASVKNADGVRNVANIIATFPSKEILIVVSAMGKMTNALELLTQSYYKQKQDVASCLDVVKTYHLAIANELFEDKKNKIFDELNNKFIELEWVLEDKPTETYDYLYDQIVSVGEYLSTLIVSYYLNEKNIKNKWIDVRDLIRTDNNYREGHIEIEISQSQVQSVLPAILKNELVITQGFVGGTSENYCTTLGREGSDYSAAIFSNLLNAEKMTVWKDVNGVMNADPRSFSFAKLIPELSYQEAIEMTYYGASVIHPKTIKPIQNKNIPLFVRSFIDINAPGTAIGLTDMTDYPPIVVQKQNQILASISTNNFSFMNEKNLMQVYQIFTNHKMHINTSQQSAMSFSVCFDNDDMKLGLLLEELKQQFNVRINEGLTLLTVRHYTDKMIKNLSEGKLIVLEQITRNTIQMVF